MYLKSTEITMVNQFCARSFFLIPLSKHKPQFFRIRRKIRLWMLYHFLNQWNEKQNFRILYCEIMKTFILLDVWNNYNTIETVLWTKCSFIFLSYSVYHDPLKEENRWKLFLHDPFKVNEKENGHKIQSYYT